MCSEPLKLTEVTDKRLLKATPKGRKILIFADNSDYAYVGGVSLLRTLDETTGKNFFVQTLITSPGQSKFACVRKSRTMCCARIYATDLVRGEFAANIALSYCGKMVA